MHIKIRLSRKTKLLWIKILLCIPLLLLINYAYFPKTIRIPIKIYVAYYDITPNPERYPRTSLKILPVSHYIPNIDPNRGWRIHSLDNRKDQPALDSLPGKTLPYRISSWKNILEIDADQNRHLFVYYGKESWAQVDSPEFERHYYAGFDSLAARGIRPNQMAPRPAWITRPRPIITKGINSIDVRGEHNIVSSFSSMNHDTVSNIKIHFWSHGGEVLFGNCIFNESRMDVSFAETVSFSSADLQKSVIDILTAQEVKGRDNTINNSINYRSRVSDFRNTAFRNTTINSEGWTGTDNLTGGSLEDVKFNRRGDTLTMDGVEVVSENKIQIGAYTSLKKIKGSGILDLTSVYEPPDGLMRGVKEFVDQGGNIKLVKERLRSVVVLHKTNLSNLRFDPTRIFFVVDTAQDYLMREKIYNQLIEYFKYNDEERREYDIQYRKMKRAYEDNWWSSFKDFCQELWNDYGYDNGKIWMNAAIVFLLFFAINLFLFPKIILNGYMLDGFTALNRKNESSGLFRRFRFEFAYSLLFTLLLFWIVSIDWGKLKIKNLGIAFWIMFQYIISLLILTFIVKSIFQ